MLDCAITGGTVVDGSGRPGVRADVGIREGRIVAVGELQEAARSVIDADGRVVAPGFVDLHTHYDAQVMWDSGVSPSSLHGVTTVIGGNCGFTIAPVGDDSADYVMRLLACVEGMPIASLEGMLDFRWRTFGEWLDRLEGRLALNAGFFVGHSTVRKLAMGDAWQEQADDTQIRAMAAIVDESVRGGAVGFSSSWGAAHGDHLGNRVPSRYSSAEELVALCSVLRDHPGTTIGFIGPAVWSDDVIDMMIRMTVEGRSPLNWNLLTVGFGRDPAETDARLTASDGAAARGGEIRALCVPRPLQLRINLMTSLLYNMVEGWPEVLKLPPGERIGALRDPANRRRMAAGIEERRRIRPSSVLDFEELTIQSVESPGMKDLEGRLVGDIARERGASALDTFLDIAVDDGLLACFSAPAAGDDDESWRVRAHYWQDPRVLVGGSDAGAHVDALSSFAFFTDFVGPTVRDRGLLTLEDAVHKVTGAPARFLGLRDRGLLAPGYLGDVVVFDPATVASGDVTLRKDMPGDELRLFADALGVEHVLVNGVEIVDHGALTGDTPGTILRPGRDTGPPA